MEYKITMPRLTDTMETGKIVRWLKNIGDKVEKNEPIVEVESDKAVMEVPSFKSGILVKILAEEGDEVPVGEPIAVLETEEEKATVEKKEEKVEKKPEKKSEEEFKIKVEEVEPEKLPSGTASPAARKLAKELGVDLEKLQKEGKIPSPAHEKDIKNYFYSKFFTEKALELAKEYNLSLENIYNTYKKKINEKLVENYIQENNIPLVQEINSIQKSLISSLKRSLEIPVFHIYEEFDFSLINWDKEKTFTAWFIKVLGDFMVKTPKLRTVYREGKYYVYPNVNISVAVATEDGKLFAPVVKQVDKKSVSEISQILHTFKEKAKKNSFSLEELSEGTFAVSNLGMFGITSFDAIIPPEHVGIVAIGKENEEKKTKLTFSFDHRIINGSEAALIVKELESIFLDEKYISSLK